MDQPGDYIKKRTDGAGSSQSSSQRVLETNRLAILERLKEAFGARTDADLARALGVVPQAISSAKARRIPSGWLMEASEKTGRTLRWLMGSEFLPSPAAKVADKLLIDQLDAEIDQRMAEPDPSLFAYVPVVEARLSAGNGTFIYEEDEQVKEVLAFRRDWLKRVATAAKNIVLMFVIGDSMEPTLMSGDMVMIDTGRKEVHAGRMYAIGLDEVVAVKRLEQIVGGKARVISDNRVEYPPYEASLSELRIIGQIIWFCRDLVRR